MFININNNSSVVHPVHSLVKKSVYIYIYIYIYRERERERERERDLCTKDYYNYYFNILCFLLSFACQD